MRSRSVTRVRREPRRPQVPGAGLALFGGRATLFAIGLGLLVEASATLTLDLAAHRRSRAYAEAIERSG